MLCFIGHIGGDGDDFTPAQVAFSGYLFQPVGAARSDGHVCALFGQFQG